MYKRQHQQREAGVGGGELAGRGVHGGRQREVGRSVAQRRTQPGAHQFLGQGPAEQLHGRGPQPLQMEVEAAEPAVADLRGGEVGVAREGERGEVGGGGGAAVEVRDVRGIFAHGTDVRV